MKLVMQSEPSLNGAPLEFVDEVQAAFPQVTVKAAGTAEDQVREIRDADAYYGFASRDVFRAADKLSWLHWPGTGIDKATKIPELLESDVVLTNARGPHAPPMADHAIGMMVNLAHRWRELFEDQRAHRWETPQYVGRYVELAGRTMGILALGDIGTEVARRAHGFGMKVYAVDKYPKPPPPEVTEVWGLDRLDEMLGISDWFVVTAPLTAETRGLMDRRRVGLLKDGAYVIVISRGEIVDEEALLDSLRSGKLAGAGLDATAEEPLPADSPFWDMDNVVITPHASAYTPEMEMGRTEVFKENLRRFLANEPFLYVCDKRAGF